MKEHRRLTITLIAIAMIATTGVIISIHQVPNHFATDTLKEQKIFNTLPKCNIAVQVYNDMQIHPNNWKTDYLDPSFNTELFLANDSLGINLNKDSISGKIIITLYVFDSIQEHIIDVHLTSDEQFIIYRAMMKQKDRAIEEANKEKQIAARVDSIKAIREKDAITQRLFHCN